MFRVTRTKYVSRYGLFAFLYSALIAVSLAGNAFLLRTIAKRKELWNTRNLLIANLAVSDISESR